MFVWVCGSNIEEEPEPVEVVSEMDEPDEKGGKDRSEGDGEDGTGGLGDESSREFWGKIVFLGEENVVTPLVRLLGLNFGASLKGTARKKGGKIRLESLGLTWFSIGCQRVHWM